MHAPIGTIYAELSTAIFMKWKKYVFWIISVYLKYAWVSDFLQILSRILILDWLSINNHNYGLRLKTNRWFS